MSEPEKREVYLVQRMLFFSLQDFLDIGCLLKPSEL